MKIALLSVLVAVVVVSAGQGEKTFVCYFSNWSQYRPGVGEFQTSDIDPYLCTHIVYSFFLLTDTPQPELNLTQSNDATQIKNIMRLKHLNTHLIVTAAVLGSELFARVCESDDNMNHFVETSISFLRSFEFDGLDMNWIHHRGGGSPAGKKQEFTSLLKKLRFAFDNEDNGMPALLLTAVVSAELPTIEAGYEIPEVCELLDLVHLKAYDFNGYLGPGSITDHNAPLYRTGADHKDVTDKYYVEFALDYWIGGGCPANKMVLGIPMYGRGFTLTYPLYIQYGAPASGPSNEGPFTTSAGMLSYYEICHMYQAAHVTDDAGLVKAPAFATGDQWIGYDDAQSVREKVKLLQNRGLIGAMMWSLDLDDFKGICPGAAGTYSLARAIKEQLNSVIEPFA